MPLPLRPFLFGLSLFATFLLARASHSQDAPAQPAQPDDAPTETAQTAPAAPRAARGPLNPPPRRQQVEERLRSLMNNLGITTSETQDAIIDYLAEDEASHATMRVAEKRLMQGVRRDVPPERMRDLIADYKAAIEADKERRVTAQNKLDARVGYSFSPKLEAMLWLMGVLGEGTSKLPTGALTIKPPEAPPPAELKGPIYGPLPLASTGARGEIVGTVTAKGVSEKGENWLEIRDDSGALDRYAPLWRDDLRALDPAMSAQFTATPVGARVRVQWVWQERRRAQQLEPEDAPRPATP